MLKPSDDLKQPGHCTTLAMDSNNPISLLLSQKILHKKSNPEPFTNTNTKSRTYSDAAWRH
jgi:hypothetical protein